MSRGSDLREAIEIAMEDALEDFEGVSADEIYYDIAMAVIQQWPNRVEAREVLRANGWSKDPWS